MIAELEVFLGAAELHRLTDSWTNNKRGRREIMRVRIVPL
jgi:hypothetical protein